MTTTPSEVAQRLEHLVGERTVPDLWHENYWFRRHEAAYLDLGPAVRAAAGADGVVVEAGSGEGYGVRLLTDAGVGRLVALDYDALSTAHTALRYPEAAVARTNLAHLPLASSSVAVVTCLQVIEHLWTPWEFLAECARVLRPGGLLVVTTPNRPVFSPGLGRQERPPNPYHVREFDGPELVATMAAHLDVESVHGVVHGPRLAAWERAAGRGVVDAQLAAPPHRWEPDLDALVRDVVAADFPMVPLAPDGSAPAGTPDVHDLVVLARRPAEEDV